jgi:hypothetical protein
MELAVTIPEGHKCTTCLFLSFNYVEVSNGLKKVHVYCRLKRLVWESDTNEVMKHEDCPAYDIDKLNSYGVNEKYEAMKADGIREGTS